MLLRDGAPLPLTPKALDILLVLVTNNRHIVEKEDLMKQVWPDSFVEEGNLTFNISTLRRALGESAGEFTYIETIPRRGYRFVADVKDSWDQDDLILQERIRSDLIIQEEEITAEVGGEATAGQTALTASSQVKRAAIWRPGRTALIISLLLVGLAAAAVYAFIWNGPNPVSTGTPARVIAVLPFRPISSEDRDEYLELGMADALISKLSNMRQVIVRPTSSVRKYVGAEQDPVAAGRELKAETVLEGSIQRLGDKIRVTVQLVSVRDGAPLWAENFDERLTDVFAVQDSISAQVARALKLKLTGEEQRLLARRYTENTEAYQAYLKGRYFWNKRSEEGYKRAIEHFQQAIEQDPTYAQAYAGLADSYVLLGPMRIAALPRKEVMLKAKAAALKALEIDDTLAEAHTSLAFARLHYDWDWSGAEKEFRRAIELNPNYATAHHWYAYNQIAMGRMDEAIAEIKRAQEADPLSLIINTDVGEILYYARRYDEAIEQSRKTLEMDSNFVLARRVLAWAYLQKGMRKEAIAELHQVVDISGGETGALAWLAHAYAVAGERGEALDVLNKLKRLSKQRYVGPISIAKIYIGLGEKDQAFAWLERVYEQRDGVLILLKVWPLLDPLRSDPRFIDLERRIGLIPQGSRVE